MKWARKLIGFVGKLWTRLIKTIQTARAILFALLLLILKFLLAYTYIFIVAAGGIFLFLGSFLSPTVDTTLLTNIGFGIFAVLANICFSWSRSFPNDQALLASKITFQGERLLLSALAFLVASFLKYLYLQKAHYPQLNGAVFRGLAFFIYAVFYGAFIYAYIMATAGIYELFLILLGRHVRRPSLLEPTIPADSEGQQQVDDLSTEP